MEEGGAGTRMEQGMMEVSVRALEWNIGRQVKSRDLE